MPGPFPQAAAIDLKIRLVEAGAETYLIQAECAHPPLQANEQLPCAWMDERLLPIAAQLAQEAPFDRVALTGLGKQIFAAILRGCVRDLYRTLQARLEQRQRLRLLLELQPRRLRPIPWELMYDPWLNDFTGWRDSTVVIRYTPAPPSVQAAPRRQGVSILVVIARPIDLPPINLAQEGEQALIRTALAGEERAGRVRLTIVGGKPADIRAGLAAHPDVLHFIGHGQVDAAGAPGLLLEDPAGLAKFASPDDLRRDFLAQAVRDGLRLVVLNACQTAETPSTAGYDSLAHELLPLLGNVVAMLYPVSDDSASAFASALYRGLGNALPLDEAVAEARQGIFARDPLNLRDGLAPVLVTHGQDFMIEREWQPFKGPHPYTSVDAPWFFERQASVQGLQRLLEFHPVVLLHGASHCGKTSLVQAGLIPAAGSRRIVALVPVQADLEARLTAAIDARLGQDGLPALFASAPPGSLAGSLAGSLEKSLGNLPDNLTICLDRVEQASALGEGLQSLLRALAQWAAASQAEGGARRLLLVAQVDAAGPPDSILEWPFLKAIDIHPMRLEPLDRDAVFRAIDQLTRNSGAHFSPEAVTHILRHLDYEQSPDMLKVQVICRALHRQARQVDCPVITPAQLTEAGLGSVESILLRDFELNTALQGAVDAYGETARLILAQFVRADQRRARPVPESTLLQRAARPPDETRRLLNQLVNDGILRFDAGLGLSHQESVYELVHDALVKKLIPWVSEAQLTLRRAEEVLEKAGGGLLQIHSPDGGLEALAPLRPDLAAWLTPAQQNLLLASTLEANTATETEARTEALAWLAAFPHPETALPALTSPYRSAQARARAAPLLAKLTAGGEAAAPPALDQLLSLALDDSPEVRQAASQALAPLVRPSDLSARLTGLNGPSAARAEQALARIYQLSGLCPTGCSLSLRLRLVAAGVRLNAASLAINLLVGGLFGGAGFSLLALFNWYRNVIAGSAASSLDWLSLAPIGLLAFFIAFPGSSLAVLGRDLARLVCGGQQARHAAWGVVLGSSLGMMVSLFLFAVVRQAGSQQPFAAAPPATAGVVTGMLVGAGWLPALLVSTRPGRFSTAWLWLGAAGAALMGALAVFVLAVELNWWPYTGYYLLSPATFGDARVIGALPGLAIGLGLSLTSLPATAGAQSRSPGA